MDKLNIDAEIRDVEMQIAFWRGKLDILQTFKRIGAVVQVPELVKESPQTVQPAADSGEGSAHN